MHEVVLTITASSEGGGEAEDAFVIAVGLVVASGDTSMVLHWIGSIIVIRPSICGDAAIRSSMDNRRYTQSRPLSPSPAY